MRERYFAGLTASLVIGCARRSLPVQAGEAHRADGGAQSAALLPGRMTVNGVEAGSMAPGQPADWTFRFFDPQTRDPIQAFDLDHGKGIHLVVVSQDLSGFAHLHPELAADGSGAFTIPINVRNDDPDNQDAVRAVTKPGPHLLFAEVVPKGQSLHLAGFSLTAEGTASLEPLKPDPMLPEGKISKYFTADGSEGATGDAYLVTLTVRRGEHHPGSPRVSFAFHIQEAAQGGYQEVSDLESWLGMPGHALIIGERGSTPQDKVFRHLHPEGAGHGHGGHAEGHAHAGGPSTNGPEVAFVAIGDDVPPADTYKLWGQFKHHGRVLTFPFVIQL